MGTQLAAEIRSQVETTYVSVEFSEGVESIETVHVNNGGVDTQLIPVNKDLKIQLE